MFHEPRLIFKENLNLGKLIDPRSTSEERAGQVLNANPKSAPFNDKRVVAASKEFHHPITNAITSIRAALHSALIDLPQAAIKKTAKVATDITTGAVAIPANIGRFAMDLLRLPPRLGLIVMDKLAEGTFGRISAIAKSINEKVHHTIDSIGAGGAHSAMAH